MTVVIGDEWLKLKIDVKEAKEHLDYRAELMSKCYDRFNAGEETWEFTWSCLEQLCPGLIEAEKAYGCACLALDEHERKIGMVKDD